MVWKLSNASSRPWLISGWYGVYAVYQAGSSSTLRRMTAGVWVLAYPMPIRLVRSRFRSANRRRVGDHGGFRAGRGQVERGLRSDRGRDGLVEQVVQRLGADDLQHLLELLVGRPDVAGDEVVVAGQLSEGSGLAGAAMSAPMRVVVVSSPRCHRHLRVSPGAVAGLSPSVSPGGPGLLSSVASPVRSGCLRDSGVVAPSAPPLAVVASRQRAPALPGGFVGSADTTARPDRFLRYCSRQRERRLQPPRPIARRDAGHPLDPPEPAPARRDRRAGEPWPGDRGSPPTVVASQSREASAAGKRRPYPVTERTSMLAAPSRAAPSR